MSNLLATTIQDSESNNLLGAWKLITTQSFTSTISFTGLSSNFALYCFIFTEIDPTTSDNRISIQTSSNDGSSYDSGASDYARVARGVYLSSTETISTDGDNLDSQIYISTGDSTDEWGNAANEEHSAELLLFNPSATGYTRMIFKAIGISDVGQHIYSYGGGVRLSTSAVNAIQFTISGGINDGTVKLYGLES